MNESKLARMEIRLDKAIEIAERQEDYHVLQILNNIKNGAIYDGRCRGSNVQKLYERELKMKTNPFGG
jgi:hypothetical protein